MTSPLKRAKTVRLNLDEASPASQKDTAPNTSTTTSVTHGLKTKEKRLEQAKRFLTSISLSPQPTSVTPQIYTCKYGCEFTSGTQQELYDHHTEKHIGVGAYQCPHCPSKFDRLRLSIAHSLAAHPDLPPPAPKKACRKEPCKVDEQGRPIRYVFIKK